MAGLKVIDITNLFKGNDDDDNRISKGIYEELEAVGACYITGHEISEIFLNDFRETSNAFFQQSDAEKEQFTRHHTKGDYLGWTKSETVRANPDRPPDLREAFDFCPFSSAETWKEWSSTMPQGFQSHCEQFFQMGTDLALKLLAAITKGMGLKDGNIVSNSHSLIGKPGNISEIRTTFQVPTFDKEIKPKQVRLGEHTDFGTISLFFQDNEEGFQIFHRTENIYIPAIPKENSCILYVGDMLQIYTGDKLTATKNRVLLPVGDTHTHKIKQDFVVYLTPDNEALVSSIDGSTKYPPTRYIDLLDPRLQATWN